MTQYENAFELLTADPHAIGIWTLRHDMMNAISDSIKVRHWTQKEASEYLGLSQPRISNLQKGKISKFSVAMLIEMLGKLDFTFEINIIPPNRVE
jgi:predicted XRE-type DNA-binding protein